MDLLDFWKKLNRVVKSGDPMKRAGQMLDSGEISREEASWALAALATLPLAMIDAMEKKG